MLTSDFRPDFDSTRRAPYTSRSRPVLSRSGIAALARRFSFLWEDGYAEGPVQAAIRFVIGNPAISTALVGYSSMEQLDYAIAASERGPLPGESLERLQAVWEGLAQG